MVNGRPRYTLSSYEPIEIDLLIRHVTPQDVEGALAIALKAKGGTEKDLGNAAWLKEKYGLESETVRGAEEIAVLGAFAANRKIRVSRQEIASLLGMPPQKPVSS